MESFDKIHRIAADRKGATALAELLPTPKSAAALRREADDRLFSQMSLRVFSAGLKHSMVEGKWPDFEEVFFDFDPARVRAIPDEDLEGLMAETRIIRHWGKIKATRANAAAMCEIADEAGSFANWLADWPVEDAVGLWDTLQKRFNHLGGSSGSYFLRMVGKDTFMLSPDVVKALNQWGAYSGEPKGKRAKADVQGAFNDWMAESGMPLCQISRILACSVD